jgi:hypothetical protein|tara:strand:- start:5 stop:211 length:207 start_codon:yes stop_codon:yes gene_type:complete
MNPNVGKYTYSEVKEMTIFRRYELFGCLEAEDVMKSMLKESKEEAFTGSELESAQLEEMVDIHYIENN